MSTDDEIERLEREIGERQDRIDDLKGRPMTSAQAARLAKANPERFNARYDEAVRRGRKFIDDSPEAA